MTRDENGVTRRLTGKEPHPRSQVIIRHIFDDGRIEERAINANAAMVFVSSSPEKDVLKYDGEYFGPPELIMGIIEQAAKHLIPEAAAKTLEILRKRKT